MRPPRANVRAHAFVRSLSLLLACAACDSSEGETCGWPKALDRRDENNSCVASRFLLQCAAPGAMPGLCTTDQPSRCSGNAQAECQPLCGDDEYAVSCGMSDGSTLPAACRRAPGTAPELGFFCCTCE